MLKKIILVSPRGPCAGVNRAITIIEKTLQKYGTPLYVNHDLVHNTFVVQELEQRGVIFTKDVESIPSNCIYLFSAHGVSPEFRKRAEKHKLQIIDATCPLVTKVHHEAEKYASNNTTIFFIGHKGHPEAIGTTGVAKMHLIETRDQAEALIPDDFDTTKPMSIITQTTLSTDDTAEIISVLWKKFPKIQTPPAKDICYATTNRQTAMKELAKKCELIIVVGSKHSSNSNRLVETAQSAGAKAFLVDDFTDIPEGVLDTATILGISSGASVPDVLVENLIAEIQKRYPKAKIENVEVMEENVKFGLPEI